MGGGGDRGSAGHGGSGVGGFGGSGNGGLAGADADGGESCQQLMDDYAQAVAPAIACIVGASNQCQRSTLSLDCTACARVVQDATTLDALRAQMLSQSCIHPVNCPCIIDTVTCVRSDGGSTSGICID